MITIYGVYRSRATRPLWLLHELGAEFRHVPVIQSYRLPDPFGEGAQINTASPDFLAINPAGAIPVMEDDGFVLTESLAITLYIARKFGGPMAPADMQEDAKMVESALYAATSMEAAAIEILYAQNRGGMSTPEGADQMEAAAARLRRPFKVLEKKFAAEDYLIGNRFTVADINAAEIVRYAEPHHDLMEEFPAIQGWLKRVHARPAFQEMWTRRAAEPM